MLCTFYHSEKNEKLTNLFITYLLYLCYCFINTNVLIQINTDNARSLPWADPQISKYGQEIMCPETLTGHWIRLFVHRTVGLQVGERVGYVPETRKTPHNWVTTEASHVALAVKNPPGRCRRHKRCGFHLWVGKIPWRRKWQPTPVFLPGESHGQRSLVGYSPWGCKKVDKSEQLTLSMGPKEESTFSMKTEIHVYTPNALVFINKRGGSTTLPGGTWEPGSTWKGNTAISAKGKWRRVWRR